MNTNRASDNHNPRLIAVNRGYPRLFAVNRAKNFSGGCRASTAVGGHTP